MGWYDGPTLLYLLETVHIASDYNHIDCRFPVQYVIRPNRSSHHDYRGYAGRIAGGIFKPGDSVMVLPSGITSTIKAIDTPGGEVDEAFAPMAVTLRLTDEVDISRGDMIVRETNLPRIEQELDVMVCWLNPKPLTPNNNYRLMHTTRSCRCVVKDVLYRIDINTLHRLESEKQIGLNDLGRVSLRITTPLFVDSYRRNRITGSLIFIDEFTHETAGAGLVI
jgi:sulfate adenylyltransferase subunit 1